MASGLNKAILMGHIGNDAELSEHDRGMKVKFRLATSESWRDKESGEKRDRTEWHNVVLWGPRAEGIHKYLTKGTRVLVEGRIETHEYQDAQGVKQRFFQINARDIQFAGGPRKAQAPASSDGLDLDAVEADLRSRDYAAQATA
jgi:single-strand DNA-binding protein